ncbi:hypothetical protein [Colwellia sp. MEBiC06753]
MARSDKKDTLINYNQDVGKAYHISKNGVINVDLHDQNFKAEFMKQLRKIKQKREELTVKFKEGEVEIAQ